MFTRFCNFLITLLGGITEDKHMQAMCEVAKHQFDLGELAGVAAGEKRAKIKFAVLPLPFTESQLLGREYGEFVTPVGFATPFGECNIPAPGPHGYEQRAYYVGKHSLDVPAATNDLTCHAAHKFHNPAESDALVPVIVTVLR